MKVSSYKTFGTYTHRHWFSYSQWSIPNQAQYEQLQQLIPQLDRPYTTVRAEYDKLHQKFLLCTRRTFNVDASNRPFTDVWNYCTTFSNRRHPCQKPKLMINDMIKMSSNIGDVILDPFAGSCVVAECAQALHRHYIGIEKNKSYYERGLSQIGLCR